MTLIDDTPVEVSLISWEDGELMRWLLWLGWTVEADRIYWTARECFPEGRECWIWFAPDALGPQYREDVVLAPHASGPALPSTLREFAQGHFQRLGWLATIQSLTS